MQTTKARVGMAFLALALGSAIAGEAPVRWSVSQSATDGVLVTVVNTSRVPVTALTIKTDIYREEKLKAANYVYFDVLVNVGRDKPIAPDETRSFTAVPARAFREPNTRFIVDVNGPAVLFADNTTTGPPVLAAILRGRRTFIQLELQKQVSALELAAKNHAGAATIVESLEGQIAAARSSRPQSDADAAIHMMRGFVLQFLRDTVRNIGSSGVCADNACEERQIAGLLAYCRQWSGKLASL